MDIDRMGRAMVGLPGQSFQAALTIRPRIGKIAFPVVHPPATERIQDKDIEDLPEAPLGKGN